MCYLRHRVYGTEPHAGSVEGYLDSIYRLSNIQSFTYIWCCTVYMFFGALPLEAEIHECGTVSSED